MVIALPSRGFSYGSKDCWGGVVLWVTEHSRLTLRVCLADRIFGLSGLGHTQDEALVFGQCRLVPIAYAEHGVAKCGRRHCPGVGQKIGRPVEVRAMDWMEAQAEVASGQADALLQMNRTPVRRQSTLTLARS